MKTMTQIRWMLFGAFLLSTWVFSEHKKAYGYHNFFFRSADDITSGTLDTARLDPVFVNVGATVSTRIDELQADLSTHSIRVDELQADLSTHSVRVDELQADLSTTAVDIDDLYTTVDSTRTDLTTAINSTHTAFRDYSSTASVRIDELQADLSTHSVRVDELEIGISTTGSQVETALGHASTASTRIDEIQVDLSTTSDDIDDAFTSINSTYNFLSGVASTTTDRLDDLQGGHLVIYEDGNLLGDVTTLDFTTNLEATISGGTVTITADTQGGGGGGIANIGIMVNGEPLGVATTFNFLIGGVADMVVSGGTATLRFRAAYTATAPVSVFRFDESSSSLVFRDSLVATRTLSMLAPGNGDVLWLSTGLNNTGAFAIGETAGEVRMADQSWMSYHQGGFGAGQMSISFWVYPKDSATDRYFLNKGVSGVYEFFLHYQQSTNAMRAHLTSAAGAGVSTLVSSAAVLNFNRWNHIVWIVDKTQAEDDPGKSEFYINNNADDQNPTDTSGTTSDSTDALHIGFYTEDAATHCECMIDNIQWYNRRLAPDEINSLFNDRVIVNDY